MTNKLIYENDWTPFNDYGYLAYKIQVDLSDRYIALQRHVWKDTNGNIIEEDWIRTTCRNINGYKQIK